MFWLEQSALTRSAYCPSMLDFELIGEVQQLDIRCFANIAYNMSSIAGRSVKSQMLHIITAMESTSYSDHYITVV